MENGPGGQILFEAHAPQAPGAARFVFVNALTGNMFAWEAAVAPALRDAGFGSVSFNFRGQDGTRFSPEAPLDEAALLSDLNAVLSAAAVGPKPPILVGLSLGGLLAAKAYLAGAPAAGLVLINTLREPGPRLDRIGRAMRRLMASGGPRLYLDAMLPLLAHPDFLAKARSAYLNGDYGPLDPAHGHAALLREAESVSWDLDYARLDAPVLVITGLHDRVFLDRAAVNRLFAQLPQAEAEAWDDAGHLVPQERPGRLVASLTRFAQRVALGAGPVGVEG
ncbi:MAG: alpha/beta fold hydrolase [Pseudomonadota bacterium]